MASSPNELHFVLIPLMAPGHIIPMIDMAKLLSRRGVHVTIIVTPLNAARFAPVIDRASASGLPIRLLPVRFPAEEAGLPPGCESAECLPSYTLIRNFFVAVNMFRKPLEEALTDLGGASCIICDKHLPWTADTCDKFRIPRIIFDGMGCFAQLIIKRLLDSKVYETSELFVVPDLPDKVEFTRVQLPGYFNPGPTYVGDFREQVVRTESRAYGVVVNSFEELEKGYLEEYRKLKSGRVWCIGPLSLSTDDNLQDRAQRGDQAGIDTAQCLEWMDNRKERSVIYACLGSLSRLPPIQFIELALGLELSGRPFILVVKGDKSAEIDRWVTDSGFEERVGERGLLIRGWAPQVLILSHSAIGGFVTHCGWNSTLEGISAGVPMITWPIFAEQFLNEKLVVQILETGVGVGARGVVHLEEGENVENKVTREGIASAIESVMDEGKDGCGRRARAKELGKMAKRSVGEGGSSCRNITLLIEEIAKIGSKKPALLNGSVE